MYFNPLSYFSLSFIGIAFEELLTLPEKNQSFHHECLDWSGIYPLKKRRRFVSKGKAPKSTLVNAVGT